jgi:polysaccharide pyruvyl transferase WcaK-like protein
MIKVLLPEDYPSHNKGEAALLHGVIESLKHLGAVHVSLFSMNPMDDSTSYARYARVIDTTGITPGHMLDRSGTKTEKLMNYIKFWIKHLMFMALYVLLGDRTANLMRHPVWKAYLDTDIVLLSHDNCYAPLYHGPLTIMFKLLKKPVAIYGGTIMPRYSSPNRLLRKTKDSINAFILNRVGMITLREEHSSAYLKRLSLKAKRIPVRCYPDLAFLLRPVEEEEVDAILRKEGIPQDRPIIGMAISQRMLDMAYPGRIYQERLERSIDAIVKVVDYVNIELAANILFMPHSIGPSQVLDDRIPADWCRARARHKENIFVLRSNYSAPQLKGLAAKLHMTLGTRLHFTIDAVSQGVPSLLITNKDDIRCHGIVGEMLGLKEYLYNIEEIESGTLIAIVQHMWKYNDKLRQELSARIPELESLTYQHGLCASLLLKEVGQC